jgi:MFS family permease
VIVFACVTGFTWLGTVPLTSGIVGQIFGVRYLSTLFGFVFFGHQIGSFLGVWLGGLVYDLTGSYTPIWWAAFGLAVFAGLVQLPLDERAVPEPKAEGPIAATAS